MVSSRDIKVGLFVLVGIATLSVVVFFIGDQRNIFARKVEYQTTFRDVQGLAPGAPVRMNGINVGSVTDVYHVENLSDPKIHVDLWVVRSESLRIRSDARAKVVNKGLLGDKMIEIEPGTLTKPPLEPGSMIRGEAPTDFGNYVRQIGKVIEKSNSLLENLDRISEGLATPQVRQDLQSSVHSLRIILEQTAQGQGYAHRLLTDPRSLRDEYVRLFRVFLTRVQEIAAGAGAQYVSASTGEPPERLLARVLLTRKRRRFRR
jgi:phospholipid/cholesterol/gamma-HCH transport system substrate-binding protein